MKKTVGFAICASHCNFSYIPKLLEELTEDYNVIPIMSFNALNNDSKFNSAKDFKEKVEQLCSNKVLSSIAEVEPIGPGKLFDLLVICPCTGNTLAKIANAISDTPVSMAFKSHTRNNRPTLLAISTNDGLSSNAKNIGRLLNTKNIFFVPFGQDDPDGKCNSLSFAKDSFSKAVKSALESRQLQPILRTLI